MCWGLWVASESSMVEKENICNSIRNTLNSTETKKKKSARDLWLRKVSTEVYHW